MKWLLIILLLNISLCCKSQVYTTVEPLFFRVGLMVDLHDYNFCKLGAYTKFWYGDIKNTQANFSTETTKVSIGFSYKIEGDYTVYFGLNRSYYYNIHKLEYYRFNMRKYSFEIGMAFPVSNNIRVCAITDPLIWETCIGVSFKFKLFR